MGFAEQYTQTLIDDAGFNVGDLIMNEVQGKFSADENYAFINGTGSNMPRGILSYPTSDQEDTIRPFATLKHIETAAENAIDVDELISVVYDLRGVYRKSAFWLMNSKTAGALRKVKNPNTGEYV